MPRRYAFEHFLVPKTEPRERATPPPELKAATAHKGEALPHPESEEGLHYGRKNAETVRRLKARAQKRQAQGADRPAAPARATQAPASKAASTERAKTSATAKAPTRGEKTVGRVAAAAKKGIQRVARKVTRRKTPKQR